MNDRRQDEDRSANESAIGDHGAHGHRRRRAVASRREVALLEALREHGGRRAEGEPEGAPELAVRLPGDIRPRRRASARRKLEAGREPRLIQTVRGWGYVLRS